MPINKICKLTEDVQNGHYIFINFKYFVQMKTILSTFLVIIALVSCNCQKPATESNIAESNKTKITQEMLILRYEALSRGFYRLIEIQNKQVSYTKNRDTKAEVFEISDEKWNELINLFSKLDKHGMKDLKDPSQARFYDGAPIANLSIIEGENTYKSVDFDGGNPPAEIKDLVNKIIEIAEQK